MSFWKHHKKVETHATLLTVMSLAVVTVGGLVEIAPLFYLESTIEEVDGMRPYTPLELMGRNIYIREGCYTCHSQMIRPMRDEDERYGHFSLAAESMYDHPFQWGSKRTGPDLARVGGRYTDKWHYDHLVSPRAVVPESIMPPYAHLAERALDYDDISDHLWANSMVGVPYTEEQISFAAADLYAQAQPYDPFAPTEEQEALIARYGDNVKISAYDGIPGQVTEMDALIAYLQMLGTLVDFDSYDAAAEENLR